MPWPCDSSAADEQPTLSRVTKVSLQDCERVVSLGSTREELIMYMHEHAFSIIDSMKVVRYIYGISLAEAKRMVTSHPVWADTVRTTAPLHDAIEKVMLVPEDDKDRGGEGETINGTPRQ